MATARVPPLVDQLQRLMRGSGARPEAHAASFPAIQALPVVKALRAASPDHQQPTREVLYSGASLLPRLRGRRSVADSELALAGLALGRPWDEDPHSDLDDRLKKLAAKRDVSVPTLRNYRKVMAAELAKRLRTLTVADLKPLDHEADPSQVLELEANLVWTFKGRVPRKQRASRTLRAGFEPLEAFTTYFTYPDDQSPDVVTVETIRHCSLIDCKRQSNGWFKIDLRLPRIEPGGTVDFDYDIVVSSNVEDRPYLRHKTRMPARSINVEVQFDPADAPTHVNPFEGVDHEFDPPGGVGPDAIPLTDHASVRHRFNQREGTHFGFGWSWPEKA